MALVWVTGARGFLGRHVARRFARSGYRVAGIGISGPSDAAIETIGLCNAAGEPAWIECAITEPSLDRLFGLTGRPDIVVHAAGSGAVGPSYADPLRDFRSSVETTAVVLDALRRFAPEACFVLPSSAAVYGARPEGPIFEATEPAPVSPYGAHKLAAEVLCRGAAAAFGQKVRIIRYFSLYGPTLRKQLLFDVSRKLRDDPAELIMAGTGEETRDFLHVEDAAELAFLVASSGISNDLVVNGGTGRASTVREVVELLARELGCKTRMKFTGEVRAGDPKHLCAATDSFRSIGFAPRYALDSGIASYATWLQDNWEQVT